MAASAAAAECCICLQPLGFRGGPTTLPCGEMRSVCDKQACKAAARTDFVTVKCSVSV